MQANQPEVLAVKITERLNFDPDTQAIPNVSCDMAVLFLLTCGLTSPAE